MNNVGGFWNTRRVTADGLEHTFALNHLAPFLLTGLLLDRLKENAPSRVVTVSSGAQAMGRIDFTDLQGERAYSGQRAYNQSKLANVLFTYELARRLQGSGVTANVLHPGVVRTAFGAEDPATMQRLLLPLVRPFMKTPEQGAATSIHLASAPELEHVSGRYFREQPAQAVVHPQLRRGGRRPAVGCQLRTHRYPRGISAKGHRMKVGVHLVNFTLPGGPPSIGPTMAAVARASEDAGVANLSLMDHYLQLDMMGSADQPMLEGYTGLGYLAGLTSSVELQLLVTGVTYRHPGLLAKIVSTLDVLSGGRAVLGIGAAWYEREHLALGVPYPPLAERFERLEETLQIVRQMWSEDDGPYEGEHFRLAETLNSPQPLRTPPILVGGAARRRPCDWSRSTPTDATSSSAPTPRVRPPWRASSTSCGNTAGARHRLRPHPQDRALHRSPVPGRSRRGAVHGRAVRVRRARRHGGARHAHGRRPGRVRPESRGARHPSGDRPLNHPALRDTSRPRGGGAPPALMTAGAGASRVDAGPRTRRGRRAEGR